MSPVFVHPFNHVCGLFLAKKAHCSPTRKGVNVLKARSADRVFVSVADPLMRALCWHKVPDHFPLCQHLTLNISHKYLLFKYCSKSVNLKGLVLDVMGKQVVCVNPSDESGGRICPSIGFCTQYTDHSSPREMEQIYCFCRHSNLVYVLRKLRL